MKRAVSGPSEVDADNGLLDMPGLIPWCCTSQSIGRADK